MIITHDLSPTGSEFLKGHCLGLYLDGQCYEFAIALHRGLKWPLVGVIHDNTIRHAVVRDLRKQTFFFDARGSVIREKLGQPFGPTHSYLLKEITEADLFAVRPITDMCIASARRTAEVVWPGLPWLDSKTAKLVAFAEELEMLSRKHRLWIRSSLSSCPPLFAEEEGDEGGYRLQPTDDGITYAIDRFLK